jgi:hypothetical protein
MLAALMGIHRYETFGLRASWMTGFLAEPTSPHSVDYLGPRQRLALEHYLFDAGIRDREKNLTPIGALLSGTVGNPSWSRYAWPCIWTALCTRARIFEWYSGRPLGVWSLEEVSKAMESTWPELSTRTIRNARVELLGTLRYTPIGEELGQGILRSSSGTRTIEKKGPARLSTYWALFTASVTCPGGLTAAGNGLGQNSVAQILGVTNTVLAAAFESLWQPDLCRISREGPGAVRVDLTPGITPEKILQRWIAEA